MHLSAPRKRGRYLRYIKIKNEQLCYTFFMKKGVIIGYGNMGETHANRFIQLGQSISIVDPSRSRQQVAHSRGLSTFTSLSEVPFTPAFISICTPTYMHSEVISEAAKLKTMPLFIEKPVVRTNEEVSKMRELYKEHRAPIFVGEGELFNADLSAFHNYEGNPKHITISRDVDLDFFLQGSTPWFLKEELSGGIVLDLMIHDITLLMAKYGKPKIGNVFGKASRYETTDYVHATLLFDGFSASLHSSWTSENKDAPIVATIDIEEHDGSQIQVVCDSYAIRDESDENDPFLREDKAFLKAIEENTAPYPLELFLGAVEVANEIRSKLASHN